MDAQQLYTRRIDAYERFVRWLGYPQGLRAYFLRAPYLASGLRVLDAGCGTGFALLAWLEALQRRGLDPGTLHGFDLTPAMLDRLRGRLTARGIHDVSLCAADVLRLDALPEPWRNYDLIISASMFEYLPPERLCDALAGLRERLRDGGTFVLFTSRNNVLTRPLIGRWWHAYLHSRRTLDAAFREAGFTDIRHVAFPWPYAWLSLWGCIFEARADACTPRTS